MAIPPELTIPTRRDLRDRHLRFRKVWNPTIDTSENGEPWLDATVAADTHLPLFAHARRVANAAFPSLAIGEEDIAFWGDVLGVEPPEAKGSVGWVEVDASRLGGVIQDGQALVIKGQTNGPRFEARNAGSARYLDGDRVEVRAVDAGAETNLPPGTVLQWEDPPRGIGPYATVVEVDGKGLYGGRSRATPEEHKSAYLSRLSDPVGGGNDAQIRDEAKRAGVAVQQSFTWPAILGAGTTAVGFTIYPSGGSNSRIPLEAEVREVGRHLEGRFGADDSILMTMLLPQPESVAFRVDWDSSTSGWEDQSPWPQYSAFGSGAIVVTASVDATNFTLGTDNSLYVGVDPPVVGKNIAFFNPVSSRFVVKRIGSVTGSGPWTIEADTINRASDESYVPQVGQKASPWSNHLNGLDQSTGLSAMVAEVFEKLGPGEMVNPITVVDGSRRLRRPRPPNNWPASLSQRQLESSIEGIAEVFDRELVEGDGATPEIGVPGTTAYLITLGDLAVYPKELLV